MESASDIALVVSPLVLGIFTYLLFPWLKVVQKYLGPRQKYFSIFMSLGTGAATAYYFLSVWFRNFVFLTGFFAYIPLAAGFFYFCYFSYRSWRPLNLAAYRIPLFYKMSVLLMFFGGAGLYYKIAFREADRTFVSPDGRYTVQAYSGLKFGNTRVELFDGAQNLGVKLIESGGSPHVNGGAEWHEDHVAVDFRCTAGDCYPAYFRLDGQQPTIEDKVRFEKTYRARLAKPQE